MTEFHLSGGASLLNLILDSLAQLLGYETRQTTRPTISQSQLKKRAANLHFTVVVWQQKTAASETSRAGWSCVIGVAIKVSFAL